MHFSTGSASITLAPNPRLGPICPIERKSVRRRLKYAANVGLSLKNPKSLGKTARILFQVSGFTVLAAGVWSLPAKNSKAPVAKKTEYNRDVRQIITKCFSCHGHDSKAVQAGLRLDKRPTAIEKLPSGGFAIVPFHPEKSELIDRIYATDGMQMPPKSSNKTLNAEEKAVLKQWILEGAEYKEHWAFVAPVRPPVPKVHETSWPKNSIDNFVLAKLEEQGLKPSPEADKRTLIRRVSLDLTGIPATPDQVNAFIADKSPNAYEKVVDRLLASPQYGERMAMDWMDYARYADSNGYQADYERFQWRWRDWVIDSFNTNMPYDEFTVDQIAGDMLPNPTLDQKIATGFNRNHRINTEGGVIPEEWRIETVIDRVETTSATWLGLTTGCARCHDHKYDPTTQKDFYSLNAFFNNVPETGSGVERPVNHPPFIKAPYPEQTKEMNDLQAKIISLTVATNEHVNANRTAAANWVIPEPRNLTRPSKPGERRITPSTARRPSEPNSQPIPKMVGKVAFDLGRSTGSVATNKDAYVDLGTAGDTDGNSPFSYALWINPAGEDGSAMSRMDTAHAYRGWDMFLQGGSVAPHFVNNYPNDALKVVSKMKVPMGKWSHVTVTYDGSHKPEGVKIYVNGQLSGQDIETNTLKSTIHTDVTTKIGRRTGDTGVPVQVDDLSFYDRVVTPAEAKELADVNPGTPFARIAPDKRTKEQQTEVAEVWSEQNDPVYRKAETDMKATVATKDKLDSEITTVMVMKDMPKPRDCYVLIRGVYDKHGPKVTAAVPHFLPPIPKGYTNNRLGLAKWIVSPTNPLTARVTVNRFWERFFGVGIVATSEDFGTRAEFPSHPELLDWLATEFLRLKWSQKAIIKEMVMSATYRQSSDVTEAMIKRDPANRLLAHGPRFRLPAEVIRDQALSAAGLLVEKIGGRSVRPYEPSTMWNETGAFGNLLNYKHDTDSGLYRRSLYTFWKRTANPPDMALFDLPSREVCQVRRARTDTPLQALVLMNDVTYFEAARIFANRVIEHGGKTVESRMNYAFNILLDRNPTPKEMQILGAGIKMRLEHYAKNPKAAKELVADGDAKNDPKIDPVELAAYTVATTTLLNTDEALTKE